MSHYLDFGGRCPPIPENEAWCEPPVTPVAVPPPGEGESSNKNLAAIRKKTLLVHRQQCLSAAEEAICRILSQLPPREQEQMLARLKTRMGL